MTWFKVDDNLAFHRKAVAAGNAAMGLWVRAGSLCSHQLSDGYIDADTARSLGTRAQIAALVRVKLWVEVPGGYQFHEWDTDGDGTKRNPTKAEVEDRRRKRADAGRQGGSKRSSKSQASASHAYEPLRARPDPTRPDPLGTQADPKSGSAWTGKPQLLLVPGTGMSSTATGNPAPRARANGRREPDVTSGNGEDIA